MEGKGGALESTCLPPRFEGREGEEEREGGREGKGRGGEREGREEREGKGT